jgi:hypothetical protein
MQSTVELEFCSRTDPRYVEMRDRHYIPNRGSQGQQLHFIVWDGPIRAGIISAGSGVYAVKSRDEFFGIPSDKRERETLWLPAIVNNTVFRLEKTRPNLGTQVLSRWQRVTRKLWPLLYNVDVIGFETFIVENPTRRGALYKAANWTHVGTTVGRTKSHSTAGGMKDKRDHLDTEPKMVYCAVAGKKLRVPSREYVSSWRRSTPEERAADKRLRDLRSELNGRRF